MRPLAPPAKMDDDKEGHVAGRSKFKDEAPPDAIARDDHEHALLVALYEAWPLLLEQGGDDLANLRTRGGLNQVDVAAGMGVAQSEISRIERQDDVKLSTLRAYIGALGGRLHLVAEINGELLPVQIGPDPNKL